MRQKMQRFFVSKIVEAGTQGRVVCDCRSGGSLQGRQTLPLCCKDKGPNCLSCGKPYRPAVKP